MNLSGMLRTTLNAVNISANRSYNPPHLEHCVNALNDVNLEHGGAMNGCSETALNTLNTL